MKTLRNVLWINALSSGATGLILAVFPSVAADLFGSAVSFPFTAVGLFLIVFAALVFAQARNQQVNKGWLKVIITLDLLWVAESALIVAAQLFSLTWTGYLLITAVAGWVGLMAFLQLRGLRTISLKAA